MPEGTFRYDRFLSNLSIGYKNPEYIGERVLPVVPVQFKTEKYPIYGPDNLTPQDDLRTPGAEAKKARWALSDASYYCEGHALKDSVPRESQTDADPQLDLIQDTTLNLTEKIMLNQEIATVAALSAALTGDSLAAQTATHWDSDDNDPVAIIRAQGLLISKRVGARANILTVSLPVWNAICLNNNVRGLITGAGNLSAAVITPQQFASLIDVDEVIIGRAVKNTAHMGQNASMDWVWGELAMLAVRPQTPGQRIMSVGYTFAWQRALQTLSGSAQQGALNGYQLVKRYYWEPNSADIVEVHKYYDPKVVAAGAACLFTDCLT
jgi:hypothetical protein